MNKYYIIIIGFLLIGCSSSQRLENHVNITLQYIKKDLPESKGFHSKIDRFEYLLKNSIEDMLVNFQQMTFPLKSNKQFTLNILFQYSDPYHHIKQSKSVNKHSFDYNIRYELKLLNSNDILLCGNIKATDSFHTPSNFYADLLSSEDSQIAAISNIITQLQLELTYFLQYKYKNIE